MTKMTYMSTQTHVYTYDTMCNFMRMYFTFLDQGSFMRNIHDCIYADMQQYVMAIFFGARQHACFFVVPAKSREAPADEG